MRNGAAKIVTATATVEFRKIETPFEFVEWAKRVNLAATNGEFMCDLQDVFARSDMNHLRKLFIEGVEQRIVLFGIYKSMGDDKFMEFVNAYARSRAEKAIQGWEADFDAKHADRVEKVAARERKVDERESCFMEWKKAIYKKIRDLRWEAGEAKFRADTRGPVFVEIRNQLKAERHRASEFKSKAARYDQIKSLLA